MTRLLLGAALAAASATLAGCGGVDLWPFGASEQGRSRVPENATAYKCDGDRTLYVRYLGNGESAWMIFPERQFRLDKAPSGSGARYTNGAAVLETNGQEARFADGPTVFSNCRSER